MIFAVPYVAARDLLTFRPHEYMEILGLVKDHFCK